MQISFNSLECDRTTSKACLKLTLYPSTTSQCSLLARLAGKWIRLCCMIGFVMMRSSLHVCRRHRPKRLALVFIWELARQICALLAVMEDCLASFSWCRLAAAATRLAGYALKRQWPIFAAPRSRQCISLNMKWGFDI